MMEENTFGIWSTKNLFKKVKRYRIKIATIVEIKWLKQVIRDIRTHTILYSRKSSGSREFGVAFIISKRH